MKYFFKKTLAFIIIPITILTILVITIITVFPKLDYYKIKPNITDIYVGDSHIRMGIVDSLLINSQNIGINSESFYFSYYRLKKIFESKNNIETVYLGFSYHSLSDYYNDYIFGKHSVQNSPKYFVLLPFSEQKKIFYYNRNKLQDYLKNLIREIYSPLTNRTFGGYSNSYKVTKSMEPIMLKRIINQYYKGEKIKEFSQINLLYLEKIINLSKKYKFKLTVINTPLDSFYNEKIPVKYIQKYNNIINKYNLNLIDFNNLTFDVSHFVPDGDHLSEIGAIKITKELIKTRMHKDKKQ